jgi:hypothetical protein
MATFFWYLPVNQTIPYSVLLHPDDGDSMFLRNIGIRVQDDTVSRHNTPQFDQFPPWEW